MADRQVGSSPGTDSRSEFEPPSMIAARVSPGWQCEQCGRLWSHPPKSSHAFPPGWVDPAGKFVVITRGGRCAGPVVALEVTE